MRHCRNETLSKRDIVEMRTFPNETLSKWEVFQTRVFQMRFSKWEFVEMRFYKWEIVKMRRIVKNYYFLKLDDVSSYLNINLFKYKLYIIISLLIMFIFMLTKYEIIIDIYLF